MTNGEFVSRVVNGVRALTKDDHISRRYILHIGRTKAKFLMSQKLDELSLFREDNIIKTISCFRLEKLDAVRCDIVEFKRCDDLMKSVNKVPETLFGKTGAGIVSVTNLDGSVSYRYSTPTYYQNSTRRKHKPKSDTTYYIQDGYLYLPNSTNEMVNITLFALNEKDAEDVSECVECDECKGTWDYSFIVPDRFLDLVLRETVNEVASIYKRIPEDENPNLDSNQKSQTTK